MRAAAVGAAPAGRCVVSCRTHRPDPSGRLTKAPPAGRKLLFRRGDPAQRDFGAAAIRSTAVRPAVMSPSAMIAVVNRGGRGRAGGRALVAVPAVLAGLTTIAVGILTNISDVPSEQHHEQDHDSHCDPEQHAAGPRSVKAGVRSCPSSSACATTSSGPGH
jgi:hypothetical protein